MRLEWIEDVLAVLDTGSFSAAAERRFLTPSAFTRRIRGIEASLGCQLFDRHRKPVTLLPHVLSMEAELREAARRFRDVRTGLADIDGLTRSRLSLGCQHALTMMVSPLLTRSLTKGQEMALRIRSGTRSECQLMLLRHEVDFALVYQTADDAQTFDRGIFDQIPLGVDMLMPVGNLRDHENLRVALKHMNLPLITYPTDIYLGEILRHVLLPDLPRDAVTHNVAETGLTPAVLQFIRQGLGIGWLPRSVAHEALARGDLTDLSDQLPATAMNILLMRTRTGGNALRDQAWAGLLAQYDTISLDGVDKAPAE